MLLEIQLLCSILQLVNADDTSIIYTTFRKVETTTTTKYIACDEAISTTTGTSTGGAHMIYPNGSCPSDIPFSCSIGSDTINTCCYESPGGLLLQTQFWDYNPATGPDDLFTIHGLWPDNCDGTYSQYCNANMEISDPKGILESTGQTELLSYMEYAWKDYQGNDSSLWLHEFNKHGTCISTLSPDCYTDGSSSSTTEAIIDQIAVDYYSTVVRLFKNLDTYKFFKNAGITPSSDTTYSYDALVSALSSGFDGKTAYIGCDKNNAISEVYYYYYVQGPIQYGTFKPIDSVTTSNCPSTGIKYPPKVNSTSTSASSGSQEGYIQIPNHDGTCLISNGKWFETSSCATYTLESDGFGNTKLKTSKGYCDIINNSLSCLNENNAGDFNLQDSLITYSGSSSFTADSAPSSGSQITISPGSSKSVDFTLKFSLKTN